MTFSWLRRSGAQRVKRHCLAFRGLRALRAIIHGRRAAIRINGIRYQERLKNDNGNAENLNRASCRRFRIRYAYRDRRLPNFTRTNALRRLSISTHGNALRTYRVLRALGKLVNGCKRQTLLNSPYGVIRLFLKRQLLCRSGSFFIRPVCRVRHVVFILPALINVGNGRGIHRQASNLCRFLIILPPRLRFGSVRLINALFHLFARRINHVGASNRDYEKDLFLIRPPCLVPENLRRFTRGIIRNSIRDDFDDKVPYQRTICVDRCVFRLGKI